MSKINFTIASIVLFGAGFNASRWFEISTVEQFDNQFNETVALIQVSTDYTPDHGIRKGYD